MPRYVRRDWYDFPLYYDIVYDVDTVREADFLEAVRRRYGRTRGKNVLEPASGSGRLMREMIRRGYRATGLDRNRFMLRYARRRLAALGDRAHLIHADMVDFRAGGGFDLAHCLLSTFQHLPTEEAARAHLRCVARALKPGGLYVLGLHLADYGQPGPRQETWRGHRRGIHVTCTLRSRPPLRVRRRQRMRARVVVRRDGREQRLESAWFFRTYDEKELRELLTTVTELEIAAVHDYGLDLDETHDLADDRLDQILVLRKPPPSPDARLRPRDGSTD